jgi:uroporphyrinogen-III synthase
MTEKVLMGKIKDSNNSRVPWLEVVTILSELVVFKYYDFDEFLKKLIKVCINVVPVDACLIYFYDREKNKLILVGSKKSHSNLLGQITLEKGEGITGWVVEKNKTVAIDKEAYKDLRFKTIKELPEDRFEAFLSVPIIDENGVVGVINFQSKLPYSFSEEQIETAQAIVKIIASAFAQVLLGRKVGLLESKLAERKLVEEAKGIVMRVKKFDEDEAYHYLRKEAMNKRKSMREIAEAVILVFK